jgi:hypothetical protein
MYYVEQKYYDNGKVKARILLESEAYGLGYNKATTTYKEGVDCDLYVDPCETYKEAEQLVRDCAKA